ncbi:MAG TPA: hypothetical protein VGF24_00025 [Vicinamibacterales bacterium]|jgi:hypothetical protein
MSRTRTAVSLIAVLLVTGCGAILHGARQSIDVQSSPAGAKIETVPATGTFTTPTMLNLERKNSYVLTFTSPGYDPATFNLHNGIGTGTVIADVLLTGLIGVLVDGMTGSWYGLEPETANVTLTRSTTGGTGPQEIHIQLREADGKGKVELRTDAPRVDVSVQVQRK